MRDIIKVLEHTPSLGKNDLIDLLLVYAGVKPTTILNVNTFGNKRCRDEKGIFRLPQDYVRELTLNLSMMQIPFYCGGLQVYKGDYSTFEHSKVYIGKSREWLDRIIQARTDEQRGLCFGFPQTAIEAYCGKRERLPYDFQFPLEFQEARRFAQFVMSKKDWIKEIETGRQWANVIKYLHPVLHDRHLNPEKYGDIRVQGHPPQEVLALHAT